MLHARNLIVTVETCSRPWVPEAERLQREALPAGFERVRLRIGFMERPDLPAALGLPAFECSYFLSRETVVPSAGRGMAAWRERLFAFLSRQASGAARHFRLPDNAVVELGTRVQI